MVTLIKKNWKLMRKKFLLIIFLLIFLCNTFVIKIINRNGKNNIEILQLKEEFWIFKSIFLYKIKKIIK